MKKSIAILIFLFNLICFSQNLNVKPSVNQEKQTTKYQKAKIYYNSKSDLKKLSNLGIALDHGHYKKNVYFESDFSNEEINLIKQTGLKVEIIIDDLKKHYLKKNNPSNKTQSHTIQNKKKDGAKCYSKDGLNYNTPTNFNKGSMGGFLTYAELLQELDDMRRLYPNLITSKSNISTFTTFEGRKLQYVKISDNPETNEKASETQVLYTAIHHAREPMSMQATIFYMWYLLENYSSNPEIKATVDNSELFFVPCVNPDGYIYNQTTNPNGGGYWRKNRRRNSDGSYGVDNNRNYSYIKPNGTETWNTAGTSRPSGSTYAGTRPFSEPENQAIRWLIEQNDFKLALNAHSYSELLLYPFGYAENELTEDNSIFEDISKYMVKDNGYTDQISTDLYDAAGTADDFMYGSTNTLNGSTRNKIFSMTPEIGEEFWPSINDIDEICKEMLFLNLSAAQIGGNNAIINDNSTFNISTTAASINYTIQKQMGIANGNFTVSLTPISTNIISVGTPVTHNNLQSLEKQSNNIVINLNRNIVAGDYVIFDLVLNNGVYDRKTRITKIFGTETTLLDDPGNNTNNWDTNDWGISTRESNSGNSSITDSPRDDYDSNSNNAITLLNPIDLSTIASASLSFYAKWDVVNNDDYVQLQISNDGGDNWTPQCGNYTNTGNYDQTNAVNEPIYDGENDDWVIENIDLNDYIGDSILIRFKLISDRTTHSDGFYFDDLKVKGIEKNTLSATDFIQNNFVLHPNPAKNTLNIKTNIERYDYKISTLQGQLISSQTNNTKNSTIDISNVATGVYFIDINHEKGKKTFKISKK